MKNSKRVKVADFFTNPMTSGQRQYEAIRSIALERLSIEEAAVRFKYRKSTMAALWRSARNGSLKLFPTAQRQPRLKKIPAELQKTVVQLRDRGMSAEDIALELSRQEIHVKACTVARLLAGFGFQKLSRRTNEELGISRKKTVLPQSAESIDFSKLEPFSVDCPSAGVFFFLPYIIESGIMEAVRQCKLPKSSVVNANQAALSMLLLKLLGRERLTHVGAYDQEQAFGIFAGLNVLPKATYMNTYSCRCSSDKLLELQAAALTLFKSRYPEHYNSGVINLDFHSIPHFGEESEMEKVWCGARGKAIKGANTVFAQDSESNAIMYTRADILRGEEAEEVKRFVNYWKSLKGNVDDTLVFDCKFTSYEVLDSLAEDGVKFITLRKRNSALLAATAAIAPNRWRRVYLPIPKRKRKRVSVFEEKIKLRNCKQAFRQIIIKDHGRANPTYVITNDFERALPDILLIYAKRWHIEQKLAEMVAFFNLNALSSPLMVRIHFDIFWTMVADALYRTMASDLRRFEHCLAPTIFKKFIDMPGRLVYDGKNFQLRIRKRAHTPVLLDNPKLNTPFAVPWLGKRTIEIIWTA